MLFDDKLEDYQVNIYKPNMYKVYSNAIQGEDLRIKDLLEIMFSKISEPFIKSSIKAEIRNDFHNGFYEMAIYHYLKRCGVEFTTLSNSTLSPDFVIKLDNSNILVEATNLRGIETRREKVYNRNGQILNIIDKWDIPGLKLEISQLRCNSSKSPNLKN